MTTPTTWEAAKANLEAACARLEQAGKARSAMETDRYAVPAPEREVTYMAQGFTVRNVTVGPEQVTTTLTRHNYGSESLSEALKCHPDYVAFGEDLAVWQAERAAKAKEGRWEAVEREWEAALDAHTDTLRQLMQCPVETVDQISEKIGLARSANGGWLDEDDLSLLVTAIAADLGRVSGRA